MRLPGTRYQEHGWEQVRKLLGQCSLRVFAEGDATRLLAPGGGELYVELVAQCLHEAGRSARATAPGNSYGDSVLELSFTLLYELQARQADWSALRAVLAEEFERSGAFWLEPGGDALLRKKINDMYATLRDKVDADNYQVACGRPCSANRMYAYRMLDTAYSEIARLFAAWPESAEQVGAILGRPLAAAPIEARQMHSIRDCRAEWVLAWSETRERFTGSPGPLHTRSKRFASLKNSPEKIGAMLREIGEYEELSANRDHDWLPDGAAATVWLEDYWRVIDESLDSPTPGPDQILEVFEDELDQSAPQATDADTAAFVAPSPGYISGTHDASNWVECKLAGESQPVRLAVYLKLLGPMDDCYPVDWLDPATGALPTMQQLAQLGQVSLPTLRKRRDAAILRLLGATMKEEHG
ncbi:hypothetical protein [Massilia horti]|uniref:Uncharacterized protein n=1 Tax=Massilia horti TaxID=2562153 RepID=A0A4Y9SZJ1_9BURK|nr:hypothetical protein [Massilia horti]TFW31867.1 hypothetical protein E4O92_12130 [Massilia horti]